MEGWKVILQDGTWQTIGLAREANQQKMTPITDKIIVSSLGLESFSESEMKAQFDDKILKPLGLYPTVIKPYMEPNFTIKSHYRVLLIKVTDFHD